MIRMAIVTGQEMTSERSIALLLVALSKSDHKPGGPREVDLHAIATRGLLQRALERVGGTNHRIGVTGRPGLHDRRVAIGRD